MAGFFILLIPALAFRHTMCDTNCVDAMIEKRKANKMKIQTGMILENKLSNGSIVVVRVLGWIESVQMWRVTDARETKADQLLIEQNRTWAVPIENLNSHDADCDVCHKDGLVYMGVK